VAVKIGVVVLSYNKAHSFPTFWGSLMGQTRTPDEIVIVDDGSVDGTERFLRALPGRWTVLHTPRLGQSAARNRGLASLNADVDAVIFLDGDLTLQMNMIGRMEVELLEHPEASFVYCHYDRSGAVSGKVLAKPWDLGTLKRGNYISPMSLCRRIDLPVDPFDPELERYEDWDLWLRMGLSGKQGRLIDETLFTAHYLPQDLSGKGESQDHFFAIKQKHRLA
jgi:glycosyltransferase involved in cell wall biosynthesis